MAVFDLKKNRHYIKEDLVLDGVDSFLPLFKELESRAIQSKDEFIAWLKDRSETEAWLYEDAGWRYIKMTINTADENAAKAYETFVTDFDPVISEYSNKLNIKTAQLLEQFPIGVKEYQVYLRNLNNELKLFRQENIPVNVEINKETQRYASISGGLHIEYKGKTYTLPQAAVFLKDNDRNVRQEVFELINKVRHEKINELNLLFDHLIELRSTVASNAGFTNFRDYKFKELARFDYTVDDCFALHKSIEEAIVPLVKLFMQERKERLQLDQLRPWDLDAEIYGSTPLKPFTNGEELTKKTFNVFGKLDPYFADCIETMEKIGHFDLESKKGKAPGGYNYPLYETGIPFIFMNAVGTQRDMVTMMHEGGHAVHSCLTRDLTLTAFKSLPSEVAELASMTMELISMDYWNEFYSNEQELNRAKKEQLEKIISILPWIATVDAFQHQLYLTPKHSHEERNQWWQKLNDRFSTGMIDYSSYEWVKEHSWQRQLHIFEVPFYYIEYAIAQLGAIALWRNYRINPKATIENYKKALALGSTATIPEVYEAAGIRFDMSANYVNELAQFVKSEYDKLKL